MNHGSIGKNKKYSSPCFDTKIQTKRLRNTWYYPGQKKKRTVVVMHHVMSKNLQSDFFFFFLPVYILQGWPDS